MQTVRIGFLSTLYHTSHIIRAQRWCENELGVRVSWSLFGTGPEMIAAFKKGTLDIGYLGLPPAMIGSDAGIPLVCIAGGHVEGTVIMALPGFPAREDGLTFETVMARLEGSRVGIPAAGSIHDVIFRHLVMRYSLRSIQIINYDWADLIPHAVKNGDVDVAVGTPALGVLCRRECNMHLVVPPAAVWPFNPSYGILIRREMRTESSLLEGFLGLHEKACNLIREDPASAAALTVRARPWLEENFILDVYQVSPRYCASLPNEYIRSTLAFVPVLQHLGYLSGRITPDHIFDTRFIEKVHPIAHHY